MEQTYTELEEVARNYYNSEDADTFYHAVWGGEDLHLGIYLYPQDSIFDASRRTVDRMAEHVGRLGPELKVLDIGAGFGGTARHLAHRFGCHVTALNLSERENERDRRMNEEQGVAHLIEVVDGTFERLPFSDDGFDVVWSQDAILHSADRKKVMTEASRVLAPGGDLIFTDPMQADDCPADVLQPIFERIHLSSLGSPKFYREAAESLGLEVVRFEDLTPHLTRHYARVLEETKRHEPSLKGKVSEAYLQRMKKGLQHWVDGGERGHLAWGIFHCRAPQSA